MLTPTGEEREMQIENVYLNKHIRVFRGDRLANIQHVAVAKFEQTHQGFQIKNHDFDLAAFTRWEKNKTLK
jgi:hypothetical protein